MAHENVNISLTLPRGRINFFLDKVSRKTSLVEAKGYKGSANRSFSGYLFWDKTEDAIQIAVVKKAMEEALTEEKGASALKEGIFKTKYNTPLMDGDVLFEAAQEKIDDEVKAGGEASKNFNAIYKNKIVLKFKKNETTKAGKKQSLKFIKRVKGVDTEIDPENITAGDYFKIDGKIYGYDDGITFHADTLLILEKTKNPLWGATGYKTSEEDEYIDTEITNDMTYDEDNSFEAPVNK